VLPLEVARGCIFKCKFCAYPLLGKNPNDNSYIKQEDVLLREILENYEKYNTTNYFIIDDTFNERSDKIRMLLNVRDRSKLDLNFGAFNRIELISRKPEQLHLLKDLSLNSMFFGIESLNYESAKAIGKGIKKEEIAETLAKIKHVFNNKVSITTGLIIGLPYETEETFQKNFEWITREDSGADTITISPLELATSTHTESSFISNPEKYGYKIINANGTWESKHWTSDRCRELAMGYISEIQKSGRQKVSSYAALVLSGLGYDFQSLIKTSEKDLNYSVIKEQQKTFINTYVEQLRALLTGIVNA
jgi:coproporphyrinogen III oxidase-like Fe-S oxidoreductase